MTADGATATDRASRLTYMPALDGLRAIAVVLVLAFHTRITDPFVPGGWVGVDVFFAISGFLITGQLLSTRASLGVFYLRRLARLWPALLVVVVAMTVVTAVDGGPPIALLLSALYIVNIFFAHQVDVGDANLVSHTWSLAIEVQFYVLWGLVMTRLRSASTTVLLAVTLGLAAASWATRSWYVIGLDDPTLAYFATESRVDSIFVGCALAVLVRRLPQVVSHLVHPVVGLLLIAVAAAVSTFATARSDVIGIPMATVGSVLVMAAIADARRPSGQVLAVLASRPFTWMGERSYSLYLWHFPAFVLLANHSPIDGPLLHVAQWAAALVAAECSFRFVETPARAWAKARLASAPTHRAETPA